MSVAPFEPEKVAKVWRIMWRVSLGRPTFSAATASDFLMSIRGMTTASGSLSSGQTMVALDWPFCVWQKAEP